MFWTWICELKNDVHCIDMHLPMLFPAPVWIIVPMPAMLAAAAVLLLIVS